MSLWWWIGGVAIGLALVLLLVIAWIAEKHARAYEEFWGG